MAARHLGNLKPVVVQRVVWITRGFVLLAALAQVFYVVMLSPQLPANFEFRILGRYRDVVWEATPEGLGLFGYLSGGAGLIAAVVVIVLFRLGRDAAYAIGVCTSVFLSTCVLFLVGVALSAVQGWRPADATLPIVVGFALGIAITHFVPRYSRSNKRVSVTPLTLD